MEINLCLSAVRKLKLFSKSEGRPLVPGHIMELGFTSQLPDPKLPWQTELRLFPFGEPEVSRSVLAEFHLGQRFPQSHPALSIHLNSLFEAITSYKKKKPTPKLKSTDWQVKPGCKVGLLYFSHLWAASLLYDRLRDFSDKYNRKHTTRSE